MNTYYLVELNGLFVEKALIKNLDHKVVWERVELTSRKKSAYKFPNEQVEMEVANKINGRALLVTETLEVTEEYLN
ncbi:hypothetical protein [Bacillus cereus]|uniref:hypothetical protein n=1 Tax=Bacillus cereus TaxID=1396 RepID=UPI00397F0A60